MTTSIATHETQSASSDRPIDLWVELGRLSRGDDMMMAQRWDAVRRSRRARRRNELATAS
jgi:hypothetical protein